MTDEIIEYCIKKWNVGDEDPRIKHFIDKKEMFYRGLSGEMETCMDSFLKSFDYYSHKSVNQEYRILHEQLLAEEGFDIDYTIFTILKSQDNSYNSSYGYTTEYKNVNQLSSNSIYPELKDCFNEQWWSDIDNIVFVDDFCGSGKTFCDYLNTIKTYIQSKHIYYVVVHVMEKGAEKIDDYASANDLQISLLCNHYTRPIFSDKEYAGYKQSFIDLSKEREIGEKHIMGYSESQALVAFCENTPNNTLGLFRYTTNKNVAIFPRKKDEKPAFLMKRKRKQKGIDNYACKRKARGSK